MLVTRYGPQLSVASASGLNIRRDSRFQIHGSQRLAKSRRRKNDREPDKAAALCLTWCLSSNFDQVVIELSSLTLAI